LFLFGSLNDFKPYNRFNGRLSTNTVCQREGVGKIRVNRTGNVRDDNGRGDFTKDKEGSRRWGPFFNRPCGLLLLKRWGGTRTLDGAYLFSGLRLLEGAVVLMILSGTTLFPSKDGLAFDVIGL